MNSLHEKNAAKSIKKRGLKDAEWLRVYGSEKVGEGKGSWNGWRLSGGRVAKVIEKRCWWDAD